MVKNIWKSAPTKLARSSMGMAMSIVMSISFPKPKSMLFDLLV